MPPALTTVPRYLWRHKLKTSGAVYLCGSSAFGFEGLQSGNPWQMGIGAFSIGGNLLLIFMASGAKKSERTALEHKVANVGENIAWCCFGGIGVCFVGNGLATGPDVPEIIQGSATLLGTSLALFKPQPPEGHERNLKDIVKPLLTGQWHEAHDVWQNIPPLRIDGSMAITAGVIMLANNTMEAVLSQGPVLNVVGAGLYVGGAWLLALSARASERSVPPAKATAITVEPL